MFAEAEACCFLRKRQQAADELAEFRAVCQQLESAASQAVDLHTLEEPPLQAQR